MLKRKLLIKCLTIIPCIVFLSISTVHAKENNQAVKKRFMYKGEKHSYIYFEPTKIRDKKEASDLILALHNEGQDGFDFLQKSGLHDLSIRNDYTIIVLDTTDGYKNMDTSGILEMVTKYYSSKVNDIRSKTLLGFGSGGDFAIQEYCSTGKYDSYVSIYGFIDKEAAKTCKRNNKDALLFSAGEDNRLLEIGGDTNSQSTLLANTMGCKKTYTFSEIDIVGGKIDFDTYLCGENTKLSGVHIEKGLGKWGKSDLYDNKYHNSEVQSVDYNLIISDFMSGEK